MAIIGRFGTVVKSNLNHWIGRAEDPEKMLNQMLLDMQEQLITAKRQVAIAIADEKRLLKMHEQEKAMAQEWEQKAMLAVKAAKDDLAKLALERKAEHEKQAQGFEQQWQGQKTAVEQLKVALNQLGTKIEEAKRKKNLLVARAKRAEAQKTISETMSGITTAGAGDTLSRMEQKIDQMEAEAQATTELASEIETDELKAKFEKLEVIEADEALIALKEKMGVQPQPSAQAQKHAEELKKIEEELLAEERAKR